MLTPFDLLFDPYAIYGKIFDPFDLLFDKQKCQTVLLTFNNNKTISSYVGIMSIYHQKRDMI